MKRLLTLIITLASFSSFAAVDSCPSSVPHSAKARYEALGWNVDESNMKAQLSPLFSKSMRIDKGKTRLKEVYCYYDSGLILAKVVGTGSEVCILKGRSISCTVPVQEHLDLKTGAQAAAKASAECAKYSLGAPTKRKTFVNQVSGKVHIKHSCALLDIKS